LTSSVLTQGATNLPTSQLQAAGGSQITNDSYQWNAGMQKNFRWGGGALGMNFNNTRLETSDTAATRNPAYTSTSRPSTPSRCCGISRSIQRDRR
jgi:hypothetical protein